MVFLAAQILWLYNKEKYMGLVYTVEYKEIQDGVLRMTFKDFDDNEIGHQDICMRLFHKMAIENMLTSYGMYHSHDDTEIFCGLLNEAMKRKSQ